MRLVKVYDSMMSCLLALIISFGFLLSGCEWENKTQPSILVIAVDALSFEKVNCDQRQSVTLGFQVFCDEAIRFTHNYTPSTMSQAALTSVLTAKYPIEHGVWHNGNTFLSAKTVTVAESAIKKGYKTAFFSGGPPIFKKSGLGQGFEKFDDNISVKWNTFYRPSSQNFNKFMKWVEEDSSGSPFFSVIYLPDLQFRSPNVQTEVGQERGTEYLGQLQLLAESLQELINKMKDKKIWHNTHIFLLGLNGFSSEERPGEINSINLYTENIQTPLFIKPAQKIRDQGINWKIDRNVSLVDVGLTLFDLLGVAQIPPENRDLEVTSLSSVLVNPDVNWNSQRYILIESAFPQWREFGGSRFSIRSGHYSLIFDKEVKLFNTLVDRNEMNPISSKDNLWMSIFAPIEKYMRDNGLNKWQGENELFINKIKLANLIWGKQQKDQRKIKYEIEKLIKKNLSDKELHYWKAEYALEKKDWKLLLEASIAVKNRDWQFLSRKKIGRPIKLVDRGCHQFLDGEIKKIKRLRYCDDPIFTLLMQWKLEKNEQKKEKLFAKFLIEYSNYKVQKAIYIENLKSGLVWDVHIKGNLGPSVSDVYLSLTKNKNLAERVGKFLLKL
jgi:hypothetical protein